MLQKKTKQQQQYTQYYLLGLTFMIVGVRNDIYSDIETKILQKLMCGCFAVHTKSIHFQVVFVLIFYLGHVSNKFKQVQQKDTSVTIHYRKQIILQQLRTSDISCEIISEICITLLKRTKLYYFTI